VIRPAAELEARALTPHRVAPRGWAAHTHERAWTIDHPREAVWAWLNDPGTFTRHQPPGYRVEFVEGSGVDGGTGFEPGVLNIHHGPLLHAPGVITLMDPGPDGRGRRRDLEYFYGAFVISPRLARPATLVFELDDAGEGRTTLRVRLESHVRPWFRGVWSLGLRSFWRFFGWTVGRGVRARERRRGATPS
jgi:hypothetical protein